MMNEKDLKKLLEKSELITALVFLNSETKAVIIHLEGFETLEHGRSFTSKMFEKSGLSFTTFDDAWNPPTIH
jgi:hypothetical protein